MMKISNSNKIINKYKKIIEKLVENYVINLSISLLLFGNICSIIIINREKKIK
jgi:hypothetical protein